VNSICTRQRRSQFLLAASIWLTVGHLSPLTPWFYQRPHAKGRQLPGDNSLQGAKSDPVRSTPQHLRKYRTTKMFFFIPSPLTLSHCLTLHPHPKSRNRQIASSSSRKGSGYSGRRFTAAASIYPTPTLTPRIKISFCHFPKQCIRITNHESRFGVISW
jgi:hypothetical protein